MGGNNMALTTIFEPGSVEASVQTYTRSVLDGDRDIAHGSDNVGKRPFGFPEIGDARHHEH